MNTKYKNIYGTWSVTTEGDVEGRSINYLGTFTGYVDEIALHLADKSTYSLRFKKEKTVVEYIPKLKEVHVSFDIESGTWNMIKTSEGLNTMKRVFHDRPVHISESNYYASFLIQTENFDPYLLKKEEALNKLTDEEKELLGLNKI